MTKGNIKFAKTNMRPNQSQRGTLMKPVTSDRHSRNSSMSTNVNRVMSQGGRPKTTGKGWKTSTGRQLERFRREEMERI